ncbi:hypothetical protein LEP1GSC133_1836, partial [Leptospira borgpetersenii serovar Pomona str. 200901868]
KKERKNLKSLLILAYQSENSRKLLYSIAFYTTNIP